MNRQNYSNYKSRDQSIDGRMAGLTDNLIYLHFKACPTNAIIKVGKPSGKRNANNMKFHIISLS